MYPAEMVAPMRAELIDAGFQDLRTADQVEHFIKGDGFAFLVVNSVCGCAGAVARPAAVQTLQKTADGGNIRYATVFAGVDSQAVQKARDNMFPFPPSSPSMAVFKNGELVHMIERHHIEGKAMEEVSGNLIEFLEKEQQ